jgi:hypothetical protein
MTLQERHAANIEGLIREGCCLLTLEKQKGGKVNIKKTAALLGVPYSTLYACFRNIHKPCHEAYTE